MNSIDTFTMAWNALSEAEQLNEWRARFVAALVAGDAGYHRFYSGADGPLGSR